MDKQEKLAYINRVFPKLSTSGQDYLQKIAHAMLLIQDAALSSIPGGSEIQKEVEADEK
jgi:hypothetical protein